MEKERRQPVSYTHLSHRMEELFEIGDYITVMRDGELVGEWPIEEVTKDSLVASMVGREIKDIFPKQQVPIGSTVLEVKNLTKEGVFRDVSFSVKSGEILGKMCIRDRVWAALHNPNMHVVVQPAPAVRVALGEEFGMPMGTRVTGKLAAALRRMGFDKVFDTDFGADLTIMEEGYEFINRVKNGGKLPMITLSLIHILRKQ